VTIEDLFEQDRRDIHAAVLGCERCLERIGAGLEETHWSNVMADAAWLGKWAEGIGDFAQAHASLAAWRIGIAAHRVRDAAITFRCLSEHQPSRHDGEGIPALQAARVEYQHALESLAELREALFGGREGGQGPPLPR